MAVGAPTVRSETLNVPVVRVELEAGLGAGGPGVDDLTSLIVPLASPAPLPAMPPPAPCGSSWTPRTVLPAARTTTSALVSAESVGRLAGDAGVQRSRADLQVGRLAEQASGRP